MNTGDIRVDKHLSNASWEFIRSWQKSDPAIAEEVKTMWRAHFSFSDEALLERSRQLVIVVRCNGKVVGVSTAVVRPSKQLNNNYFFFYRFFVDPGHRMPGLDMKLTLESAQYLEEIARTQPEPRMTGILTIVENSKLNSMQSTRRAIWRIVPFIYIGNSENGLPIRVHYFKDALI